MAEITFEAMAVALEATRGTAVTPPTHYLPISGTLTPMQETYRPVESRGTLAEFNRSKVIRKWSEWEGEGPADVYNLPVILNMLLKSVTSPTIPTGGTLARLWSFAPTMTSDGAKSGTIYWGDPNVQLFQAPFGMIDSFSLSGDASGTDGVTMELSGHGQSVNKVSATLPAQLNGPLITPNNMQVWIDTSSAIGTTEVVGRVISADFSLDTNRAYKFLAVGPTGSTTYTRTGAARRHAEATIRMELSDTVQYDLYQNATQAKVRVRFNGPLIEAALYHYVQFDIYGPLDALAWGDFEGTNRSVEFTIQSEYNATAGHDFQILVQNDRTTL